MSWWRLQIEPNAQASVATSSATAAHGAARIAPPLFNTITPRNPTTSPAISPRLGRSRYANRNSAMNSGSLAIATAAMPEVTLCSAKQTSPLPNISSSTPVIAALRHCRRVGGFTPRRRSHAYIATPAERKRKAAIVNGGKPVSPIRIPR